MIGGWLGSAIGVRGTIACGAIVLVAAALWILPLREREHASGLIFANDPSL
jgi:predicted MFS family arabinose efflux permease